MNAANPPPEPPTAYREQMQLLLVSVWRVRVWAALIGANLLVFAVLGFLFGLIFLGVILLFARLITISNSAYQLVGRMLRIPNMPARLAKPPAWYVVYSFILLVIPLGIIAAGIWILSYAGFCGQNLLCLLVYTVKK